MANFQAPGYDDTDSATANIGGIFGAIPFLNSVAPGIAATLGAGNAASQRAAEVQNALGLEPPKYRNADNVQMNYSGDMTPQLYQTPEAAQASMADDSAEGRAAQLSALQQLSKLTDQSISSDQAMRRQQAGMDARQLANSRESAIRQDAMRRGQVGGAADMISRQQAAQAAANMNQSAGLANAQQAALQQLAGTQAQGQMAGQLRGQDLARAFANQNAANQFALFNVGARNAANQANVGIGNSAQMRNLNAQQDYFNNLTGLNLAKIGIQNQNASQGYQNDLAKNAALTNALENRAGGISHSLDQTQEAGKQGYNNTKDLFKTFGGGM